MAGLLQRSVVRAFVEPQVRARADGAPPAALEVLQSEPRLVGRSCRHVPGPDPVCAFGAVDDELGSRFFRVRSVASSDALMYPSLPGLPGQNAS
jgi:hypothetical protein